MRKEVSTFRDAGILLRCMTVCYSFHWHFGRDQSYSHQRRTKHPRLLMLRSSQEALWDDQTVIFFSFHTWIWLLPHRIWLWLYSKSLETLLSIEMIICAPNNFDQWHWSKYPNIRTPPKPSTPFTIQLSNFHTHFFFFANSQFDFTTVIWYFL